MDGALRERAMTAASQVLGEAASARHVETTEAGLHVFQVDLQGGRPSATVSLNPNGTACVEWRGHEGGGYRVLRLEGRVDP